MNIYFCGSIRGGREMLPIYQQAIEYIKNYGTVLTPDVGDAAFGEGEREDMTDIEIYERDMGLLKNCDAVIADVTVPSLGVGYEVSSAKNFKKPLLCVYKNGHHKKLTPMIGGNKDIAVAKYESFTELKKAIDKFLKEI